MNVSDIISRFREQFLLFSIISCHCGYIPTDKQTTGRAAAAASILLNDRTTTMTSSSSTVLCTHFRYRHSLLCMHVRKTLYVSHFKKSSADLRFVLKQLQTVTLEVLLQILEKNTDADFQANL